MTSDHFERAREIFIAACELEPDQRPVFLDQARRLGNAWACPVTIDAGRHHFDVIDELQDGESPLVAELTGPARAG